MVQDVRIICITCVYLGEGRVHAVAGMWRSEDNLLGSVLSFHLYISSEDQTLGVWPVQQVPVPPEPSDESKTPYNFVDCLKICA